MLIPSKTVEADEEVVTPTKRRGKRKVSDP